MHATLNKHKLAALLMLIERRRQQHTRNIIGFRKKKSVCIY